MKKLIVPVCFALTGVGFLIKAVVKPLADSEPIDYSFVVIAAMFFTLAAVFFARERKSAG